MGPPFYIVANFCLTGWGFYSFNEYSVGWEATYAKNFYSHFLDFFLLEMPNDRYGIDWYEEISTGNFNSKLFSFPSKNQFLTIFNLFLTYFSILV